MNDLPDQHLDKDVAFNESFSFSDRTEANARQSDEHSFHRAEAHLSDDREGRRYYLHIPHSDTNRSDRAFPPTSRLIDCKATGCYEDNELDNAERRQKLPSPFNMFSPPYVCFTFDLQIRFGRVELSS